MTVYFQGTEFDDFVLTGNGSHNYNTSGTTFTAANVRASMRLANTGTMSDSNQIADAALMGSAANFWTHFKLYPSASIDTTVHFFIWLSGGTPRLGLRWSANAYPATIQIQKYTGTWATIGTATAAAFQDSGGPLMTFDININIGNPGIMRIYQNGGMVFADNTLDLSWAGVTGMDSIRLANFGTTTNHVPYWSEIIIADWNTIGGKLVLRTVDANGNYTAWSGGGFGVLDELVPSNDFMTSSVVDQRTSFSMADFPVLAFGEGVAAVKQTSLMQRDVTGPQNMNNFIRISTTDYDSANQSLTTTLAGKSNYWETSPATSTLWTIAELNATQFGVRSRT